LCAVHLLVIHRNVGCDISPWILNKSDEGIPATSIANYFHLLLLGLVTLVFLTVKQSIEECCWRTISLCIGCA